MTVTKKSSNSFLNAWAALSLSSKIGLIGSLLLTVSLFLPWYSDVDVFQTGQTFNGFTGPMYLLGFSIFVMAIANLLMIGAKNSQSLKKLQILKKWNFAKMQIFIGFMSMYFLILMNSVFFHPQFGLNILSKKSEYGVVLGLFGTVLVSIAGYLTLRDQIYSEVAAIEPQAEKSGSEMLKQVERIASPLKVKQRVQETVNTFDEKSEEERQRIYANMKRLMQKDTLSAAERRKKIEKANAFLGNQPTDRFVSEASVPKAQVHRMDL